jgi:hypothetical protein
VTWHVPPRKQEVGSIHDKRENKRQMIGCHCPEGTHEEGWHREYCAEHGIARGPKKECQCAEGTHEQGWHREYLASLKQQSKNKQQSRTAEALVASQIESTIANDTIVNDNSDNIFVEQFDVEQPGHEHASNNLNNESKYKGASFLVGAWCVFALWDIFFGIDWSECMQGGFAALPIVITLGFATIVVVVAIWEAFKGKSPVDTVKSSMPNLWKILVEFSRAAPRTFVVALILLPIFLWNYYGRYTVRYYGTDVVWWYDKWTHTTHREEVDECDSH